MVTLKGLSYRYPGSRSEALGGVDLSAPAGSVTVVAGESGSGKTTLLRLLAGFVAPDDGTIDIGGERVSEPGRVVAPEERGVGVVFQEFALFPHLTVEQNVAFGLTGSARSRSPDRDARVRECVGMLGIEALLERYPHELSGGQAQRVAIARALAPRPRILVMDEPFNNLNVALRHELVPLVAEVLRSTGITAVVVTHDPQEAYELADRMVLLKDGAVEQEGTAAELYHFPRTRYVAHFFGPVNEVPLDSPLARALASHELPVTDADTLVVRPETISLVAPGEGIAEATVADARFAGPHTIVELEGSWEGTLRAHVPGPPPSPGETVGVGIGTEAGPRAVGAGPERADRRPVRGQVGSVYLRYGSPFVPPGP